MVIVIVVIIILLLLLIVGLFFILRQFATILSFFLSLFIYCHFYLVYIFNSFYKDAIRSFNYLYSCRIKSGKKREHSFESQASQVSSPPLSPSPAEKTQENNRPGSFACFLLFRVFTWTALSISYWSK